MIKEMIIMPRIREEKNRNWSKEEKLRIINKHLIDGLSTSKVAKEEDISGGMLRGWIKNYLEYGEESLINKKKPGNPLSKYQNKKNLTKEEQLEYENMKLRIENELLKKGYLMKGDGTIVKFTK
jgi:transposase-like protein